MTRKSYRKSTMLRQTPTHLKIAPKMRDKGSIRRRKAVKRVTTRKSTKRLL